MNTSPAEIHTVALFGGSGTTGKALIRHALIRGIKVRALVRNARSMNVRSGLIEVIEGPLVSPDHVEFCLKGSDAAICVFGPRPPYTDIFCEAATRTIVESMQKVRVKRLVCQTGAMIGEYPANRTLPFRLMVSMFNRRLPRIASDRASQEIVVKQSGLAWTLVKPARLSDSEAKNKWFAGPDIRAGLLSSISREDLADFLIEEALNPQFAEQAVFIHS